MKRMKHPKVWIEKSKNYFTTGGFILKLSTNLRHIGQQSVYGMLLLLYAFKEKSTPIWAKNIVIGVLGYFINPLDLMPDLTPFIGYTDDLGLLAFGLVTIAAYISHPVREKAKSKMIKIYGQVDELIFQEVDRKL
jgi:uncharacterized membrane protein YkvA (DUF1232 family)